MEKIKKQIEEDKKAENPEVIVCSLHWGPNYEW
jgi:poly-gamma-glutamate capsule biosynthesis protein CapA/YwtB (metallophosphatase superfamily)